MIVLLVGLVVSLVLIAGIRYRRVGHSSFELQRRVELGDDEATKEWRVSQRRHDIKVLQRLAESLLLVVISALAIGIYSWGWGIIIAAVVALLYQRVAATGIVRAMSARLYRYLEEPLLSGIESLERMMHVVRGAIPEHNDRLPQSREELLHIIDESIDYLTPHERSSIRGALSFDDKLVKDYMTPRSVMEVIGAHELLGPLVLDDLHKTGHSHFPVLDGDIDHIVGILHLHNLLTITSKKSVTVKEVMEPKVLYIHEEQTLEEALSACIKHRRHLLVVINEFRETVGVITIEDAVEQLIGRKIVDDNDLHDDLRAVAARNLRGNNPASKGSDV